ncbi:MAG TPA: endo-1,3-alpha-glucanase family glycosylhydrolase [Capsulimonadaceae bacterium]|jgi:hypothetical protein
MTKHPFVLLTALAASLLPLTAQPASARGGDKAYGVEELPIDRFDEYQAGSFPSFPWQRIGKPADGVAIALRTDGETPFAGNLISGKGLTLTDTSATGGAGVGIERTFTPAPSGAQYLSFDLKLATPSAGTDTVDLRCDLTDSKGKGLTLTVGTTGGLTVATSKGPRRLADIAAGQWYHITANVIGKNATITLTPHPKKAPTVTVTDIELPAAVSFTTLRLASSGPDSQQGSWTVDNILTAGEVDADRKAWWPFDQLPIDKLRASNKKVYVYYFPIYTAGPTSEDPGLSWFSRTIMNPTTLAKVHSDRSGAGTEFEDCPLPYPPLAKLADSHQEHVRQMVHEVQMMRQMGIDGCFVDIQSFPGPTGGVYFNEMAFSLMEAATQVDPGFKIIPAIYGPDKESPENAVGFANAEPVKRALAMQSALKLDDGRLVISSWYPERYPATWWKQVIDAFEKNGVKVAFVPQFNSVDHLTEFSPISYGMANWGPRTPGKYEWVSKIKALTTKTIVPVVEQDIRTRHTTYFENCNSDLFRDLWSTAIVDNADWVFINTWCDYTEQAMAPSRHIGFAPFDLNAYYTQWFKTGKQPEIKRDVLYYIYRIHHTSAEPALGTKWSLRQAWGKTAGSEPMNDIELLAFLKQPGELTIQIGDKTYTQSAKAGITSFKAPFPANTTFTPVFTLTRDKKTVVSRPGRYTVLDKIEYGNFWYHSGVITPAAAK